MVAQPLAAAGAVEASWLASDIDSINTAITLRTRSCERKMQRFKSAGAQKFGLFAEQWQPKVIAEMNDYQFKIVKLQGDFIWHDHKDTDETFIVIDGVLRIDLRDGAVHVSGGEMFVVTVDLETGFHE
jgi:mannose-6-phosphate isomerase-like protein (cupin superfamily)